MRAVCLCSSADDFMKERIYLEITFLVNGYSLMFVETYVQHFFNFFHVPHRRYIGLMQKYPPIFFLFYVSSFY